MNILLEGKSVYLPRGILGYVVLSSKKQPELPFIHLDIERSFHIPGSTNGMFVCTSSERRKLFSPSKSLIYNALSTYGYSSSSEVDGLMETLQDFPLNQDMETPLYIELHRKLYQQQTQSSCLVLESPTPYGVTVLMANSLQLYLYGLYNKDQSLFVFTNMENYDSLIQKEFGEKFWIFRFAQRHSTFAVLFTRRVCSRWYRWSQTQLMLPEANRFAALEKSLFRVIL